MESALYTSGHSQRFGKIYTQNLGLFLSGCLYFCILFLLPSICGCPNSALWFFWPETLWVFIRILYTAWSMPFPSSRCQLFSTFDCNFSLSIAFKLFVFSLKFIVVICMSVGLVGAYLAISETKIHLCSFNWKHSVHKWSFL